MEMQANRNVLRDHRFLPVFPPGKAIRDWLTRNLTNEKVAEVGLALAVAIALCYLAFTVYQAAQSYTIYAH